MFLRDEVGRLFVWDLDSRLLTLSDQIDKKGESNDLPISVQASMENGKVYVKMKMGRIIVYKLEPGAPLKLTLEEDHRSLGSVSFCHFQLVRNVLASPSSSKNATGCLDILNIEDMAPIIKDISSREKTGMCLSCKFVALPETYKPDQVLLVAGYDSGLVSVFRLDLAEGRSEELKSVQILPTTIVDLAAGLRDRKLLVACGGASSQLKLISFDLKEGQLEECQGHHHSVLEFEGIAAVDMLDGCLVSGGWDAQIRLFRSEPIFECTHIDHTHRDVINQVKLYNSSRGIQSSKRPSQRHHRLLFSASRDGSINMYNLEIDNLFINEN